MFLCGLSGIYPGRATGGDEAPPGQHAVAAGPSASALFQRHCQRCHAATGKGDWNAGVSGIPDFTDRAWQSRRSDAQLVVSILDGKGDGMPAFRGRVTKTQAKALIGDVRAFGTKVAAAEATRDFATKFRELDKELQELKRQLNELTSSPGDTAKPTAVFRHQGPPTARQMMLKAGGNLYRKHCQRCHGADGKGDGKSKDGRPDFTCRAWQQRRSDAKLLTSILDGKGRCMPAFRKQISEDQAQDLIDYIRSFMPRRQSVPMTPRSRDTDQGRPPR
jgi:mono/diheme cytochrome c family protein